MVTTRVQNASPRILAFTSLLPDGPPSHQGHAKRDELTKVKTRTRANTITHPLSFTMNALYCNLFRGPYILVAGLVLASYMPKNDRILATGNNDELTRSARVVCNCGTEAASMSLRCAIMQAPKRLSRK
jgi:hypothetical protein